MKRNIIPLLTLLLVSIVSTVHAESTLTASQIKSSVDAGYEVSDNYTTLTECTTKKDAFNLQYTSYKRSDCFRDSVGYKYFICGLGESCTVTAVVAASSTSSSSSNNTTSSTSTSSTSSAGTQVSNQDKLDAFLAKVRGMKTELNDDDKYERILTSVISKLQVLKTKYASNTTVSSMVVYLSNGVTSIKDALVKNKDVDNFFCELAGGCSPTNTVASSSTTNSNTTTQTSVATQANTTSTTTNSVQATTSTEGTSSTVWDTVTSGTKICTSVGGGMYGNGKLSQSYKCIVGETVSTQTNCTAGDIAEKAPQSYATYVCTNKKSPTISTGPVTSNSSSSTTVTNSPSPVSVNSSSSPSDQRARLSMYCGATHNTVSASLPTSGLCAAGASLGGSVSSEAGIYRWGCFENNQSTTTARYGSECYAYDPQGAVLFLGADENDCNVQIKNAFGLKYVPKYCKSVDDPSENFQQRLAGMGMISRMRFTNTGNDLKKFFAIKTPTVARQFDNDTTAVAFPGIDGIIGTSDDCDTVNIEGLIWAKCDLGGGRQYQWGRTASFAPGVVAGTTNTINLAERTSTGGLPAVLGTGAPVLPFRYIFPNIDSLTALEAAINSKKILISDSYLASEYGRSPGFTTPIRDCYGLEGSELSACNSNNPPGEVGLLKRYAAYLSENPSDGWDAIVKQGPCPRGWHIPTKKELQMSIYTGLNDSANAQSIANGLVGLTAYGNNQFPYLTADRIDVANNMHNLTYEMLQLKKVRCVKD